MGTKAALLLGMLLLAGCTAPNSRLTVAAASNLAPAFDQVGAEFTQATGIPVAFSYAATTILARQIAEAAPFDVFAAADTAHLDQLVAAGRIVPGSRAVYARGQLALWAPGGAVRDLHDLAGPQVRFVAVAQPELAPYGAAAIEALKAAGLWEAVQPKLVYANDIGQAKQFASSGNADAAFTAYSLVMLESGTVVRLDQKLYPAIQQAIGTVAVSRRLADAKRFSEFVLSPRGQAILAAHGYLAP